MHNVTGGSPVGSRASATLIIAEVGVNHNGDLDLALRLVDAAAAAGADIVKFQTFRAENVATSAAQKAEYQVRQSGGAESQLEMLRRLELSPGAYAALRERCGQRGVEFLSTAFDMPSLELLASMNPKRWKVPSGEITNLPYLRAIGRQGTSVILSTGMSTLDEVSAALSVLEDCGVPRDEITVLHCTTEYPAPLDEVNLRAMGAMGSTLGVEVGYSDHTEGIEIPIAAVAMGARVIEKHFTLDRSLPGPDHRASITPDMFNAMVSGIRAVERALGDGVKRVYPAESRNREVARRSIVAARAISAGELFSTENLTVKRPGTGISPMRWDDVIGRPAPRAFTPDELIAL